jgi:hypothetical protein
MSIKRLALRPLRQEVPTNGTTGHSRPQQQRPRPRNLRRGFALHHAPDRIRTCDLMLRRHALYPTELRARGGKRNKPSSVSGRGRRRAISLGRRSPAASSSLPGTRATLRPQRRGPRLRPCLALLRVGFTMPLPLPAARWSLTPPFHPCLCSAVTRGAIGGLFSVALSSASRRPGVTRHPALRSSDFPRPPPERPRLALASRPVNQRFRRSSAPRRSRTPNLRIRSPTLYPVELWARLRKNRPRFAVRPAGPLALPRTALKN